MILQISEFDHITDVEKREYDSGYINVDTRVYNQIKDFIASATADESQENINDFMSLTYRKYRGESIQVKNYVGVIQINQNLQIEILPKISLSSGDDLNSDETKRIFLRMVESLVDFPPKYANNALLKTDKMNIYEIFIKLYIDAARELMKKGINSSYVNEENNLNFYKGKLQTTKHSVINAANKERFYVSYDEFSSNIPENRILKSTLLKLLKVSTIYRNRQDIIKILSYLDPIDLSVNYAKDFSSITINRRNKEYDFLMKWSKVFLLGKSFTSFSGAITSQSLLFPMERLFESYIGKELRRCFRTFGLEVKLQDSKHSLFTDPQKKFHLIPDIVIRKDNDIIVCDTKWKRLSASAANNYGISQADMYQMYAYSKKYESKETWLIYPTYYGAPENGKIYYKSDDGVTVKVFFINLSNIGESLLELKSLMNI